MLLLLGSGKPLFLIFIQRQIQKERDREMTKDGLKVFHCLLLLVSELREKKKLFILMKC